MNIFDRVLKDERSEPLSRDDLFKIAAGTASDAVVARLPSAIRASAKTAYEWGRITTNDHVSLGGVIVHMWRRSHPDSAFSIELARFHARACSRCRPIVTVADSIDRIRHVSDRSPHIEQFFQSFLTWGKPAYRSEKTVQLDAFILNALEQPQFSGNVPQTSSIRLRKALFRQDTNTVEVELVDIPPGFTRVWVALSSGSDGFMMPEAPIVDGLASTNLMVSTGVGPAENWSINDATVTVWLIMSG